MCKIDFGYGSRHIKNTHECTQAGDPFLNIKSVQLLGSRTRRHRPRCNCFAARKLSPLLWRPALWPKLEQIQRRRTRQIVKRPAAQAQLAVVHKLGSSTKTAIKGSKKFSSKLSNSPLPSARRPSSGICESEHAAEVSVSSKHSHLGRIVPFTMFS